jgi:hypothetical protein
MRRPCHLHESGLKFQVFSMKFQSFFNAGLKSLGIGALGV